MTIDNPKTGNSINPQARELLSPYLDGTVTAEERALVENALSQSAELRAELESLRQTVQLMQALPRVPAPRPFTLSAAEAGIAEPKKRGFFGKPLWAGLTAVVTVALVLVVGAAVFRQSFTAEKNTTEIALAPAAEMMQEATVPAAPTESSPRVVLSSPQETQKSTNSATVETESIQPSNEPAADAASALEESVPVVPLEKSAPQPMPESAESVAGAAVAPVEPLELGAETAPLACDILPADAFLTLWQENPTLQNALGCPADPHPRMEPDAYTVKTAVQPFEHGTMIWSDHVAWYPQPVIYVLFEDGTYRRFDDTFNPEIDAVTGDELPPDGKIAPVLGFGKIWRTEPKVRDALGWALKAEQSGTGSFQMFQNGEMLSLTQTSKIYVFLRDTGQVEIFDAE